MNIKQASTISLKIFINEHEGLSRLIQVTTLSLWYLENALSEGIAPPIADLFDEYAPYWRRPPIAELNKNRRDEFTNDLGRLGVIRVISAFDYYINSLSAELASIGIETGSPNQNGDINDDDKPPRFISFSNRIGLSLTEEQEKISEFINVLRNCCAHRSGRASNRLIDLLKDKHIAKSMVIQSKEKSIKQWKVEFPELNFGDIVPVTSVHAIWISKTCMELAIKINSFIVNKIGQDGLLGLAVYNIPKSHYLGKGMNFFITPQAAVNFILSQMLVSGTNEVETVALLKEAGLWKKAVKKFGQINSE